MQCFNRHKYAFLHLFKNETELRVHHHGGASTLSDIFVNPMVCQAFLYWLRIARQSLIEINSEKFLEYYKKLGIKNAHAQI